MQYNQDPQYSQKPSSQPESTYSGAQKTSTNTLDPHYDLVSVLYHALEGAQVCAQYVSDANRAGDQELSQFFMQAQQNQVACADRAKQLLARRLGPTTVH